MKLLGIVLVVIGIGLVFWGIQLSGSVESELTQAITGANTDKVMQLYIGGAVSVVVGLFLNFKK
ncbi:MAG: DUF3185 family protein [Thiotrichales bacterium]|nr:DUF3185 family protein [Thiotrichales bacterium]